MPTQPYYLKDGTKVNGVTTIISDNLGWSKNALMFWAIKMMRNGIDPIKERDKAAELGTLCHAYIEADIYGTTVESELINKFSFDDIALAEQALHQYKELVIKNKIEWLEAEYPLVSEKYRYGGCLDGVGIIGDKRALFLGDTKTSNDIHGDHIIQLGGYKNLLLEEGKYIPEEFWFIKILKEKTKILEEKQIVKLIQVPVEVVDAGFECFKELIGLRNKKSIITNFTDSFKAKKKRDWK